VFLLPNDELTMQAQGESTVMDESVNYSWQKVERLLFGVKTCSDYRRNLEPFSFFSCLLHPAEG
jgi:hypothetical protein